ncbi:hypothetical protein [Roseburia intestinalis]|jgi:hypothetical protein
MGLFDKMYDYVAKGGLERDMQKQIDASAKQFEHDAKNRVRRMSDSDIQRCMNNVDRSDPRGSIAYDVLENEARKRGM